MTICNEYELSHANGALSDIQVLVTSCVGINECPRVHELCAAIYERILASDSKDHKRPSWWRHTWEKKIFEEHQSGKKQICAGGSRRYKIG